MCIRDRGKDTPLAVLSERTHPLFNYFKQLFAQVTNPPIDAIREEIVTSTSVYLGKDGNILEEKPDNCNVLKINNPILTNTDILKLKNIKEPGFKMCIRDSTNIGTIGAAIGFVLMMVLDVALG